MSQQADDFANYGTYVNDLGKGMRGIEQFRRNVPMSRFVVPFLKTPANIFKYTFERTPVGYLMEGVKADIAAGGRRSAQAHARIAQGSAMMYFATSLAANGKITGAGPLDKKQRNQLRQSGWQPYSIVYDGKYYSYQRLEPLATILGLGADIGEITSNYQSYDVQTEQEIEKLIVAAAVSVGNQVVGKTFFQGIGDLSAAFADPQREMEQYVNRLVGSFVPSVSAFAERVVSPEIESVKTMTDAIKSRIPGLSDSVPKRRNVYGETITYIDPRSLQEADTYDKIMMTLNPIYYSSGGDRDKLNLFMLRNGLYPHSMGSRQSFNSLDFQMAQDVLGFEPVSVSISFNQSPKAYDKVQEIRGNIKLPEYGNVTYKQALTELVLGDSPLSFRFLDKATPHEERQRIINTIGASYARAAKKEYIKTDKDLQRELIKEMKKKKERGAEFPAMRQTAPLPLGR